MYYAASAVTTPPALPRLIAAAIGVDEVLTGEPRLIKVTRVERAGNQGDALPHLQQIITYLRGQKPSECQVFKGNGELYFRQIWSYGSDGRLSQIQTLDPAGVTTRTEFVGFESDGVEIHSTVDADGKEVERTTNKPDSAGRILQSISENLAEISEIKRTEFAAQYDGTGKPRESRITYKNMDGSVLLFEISYRGDQQKIQISWAPTEEKPFVAVTTPTAEHGALSQQITERDQNGNWTKKEVIEPGTTNPATNTITEITREIEYY